MNKTGAFKIEHCLKIPGKYIFAVGQLIEGKVIRRSFLDVAVDGQLVKAKVISHVVGREPMFGNMPGGLLILFEDAEVHKIAVGG